MWACDPSLFSSVMDSYGDLIGSKFAYALASFLVAQCAIVGDHLWPEDSINSVLKDPNYDFVIIGAGSAGSVLANRLSEIPDWKILLVEAGGNPTLTTEIPHVFYKNLGSKRDWGYKSQPQSGACLSYKEKGCAWPRGKGLGGCSSINAMFYVRGNKLDYDEWEAEGNHGWGYEDVLPYFKKSENYMSNISDDDKYHGTEGELYVTKHNDLDPWEELILRAYPEIGIDRVDDINGANQMGATQGQTTLYDGMRMSTARAFLSPIRNRTNLNVIKNTMAIKILFNENSNVANGILLNQNGRFFAVNVKKELIISAGTVNTPQLLMLSGIGPRKLLNDLNIEVKTDLPVGENLQDHVFMPVMYTVPVNESMGLTSNLLAQSFIQYMQTKQGYLSDIRPHRIIAFVNSTDPTSTSPDLQFHHLMFAPNSHNFINIFERHGLNKDIINQFRKLNKDNFVMIIYNALLKPKSRGKIIIKSQSPFDEPLVHANYFHDRDDLKTLIRGVKKITLKLGKTETFKQANLKLWWFKIPACENFDKASDDFLECVARELTFSLYHPTSTIKMGPEDDPSAVVNPDLKVRNTRNLRVIDASVMRSIVRGNSNAATIMIGEKGAELIKEFWKTEQHFEKNP